MLRLRLTAAAMVSAFAFWPLVALTAPVPPAFEAIASTLQGQTQVPLLLPADVPVDMFEPIAEVTAQGAQVGADGRFATFFPTVAMVEPDRYLVVLGFIPDCVAAACDFGSLAGEVLTAPAAEPAAYQFLVEDYQQGLPPVRSPQPPALVTLQGGVRGWFLPYTCGASCGESQVIFDWQGHRYTVGIQEAEQQVVVDLANSALASLQQQ